MEGIRVLLSGRGSARFHCRHEDAAEPVSHQICCEVEVGGYFVGCSWGDACGGEGILDHTSVRSGRGIRVGRPGKFGEIDVATLGEAVVSRQTNIRVLR